jgi:phosphatidylglycerophosphatase A
MTPNNPNVTWLRDPGHFLSLGFGSGLAPKAPGTFGTVAAIVVYLPMTLLSTPVYCAVTILLFFLGIWLCGRTATQLGTHDHGSIVFDEFVGFLVTMAFVTCSVSSVILGFLLFRLFDILKPWPISFLDKKVHGGFGIMIDDVIAGLFAVVILEFIEYLSYI